MELHQFSIVFSSGICYHIFSEDIIWFEDASFKPILSLLVIKFSALEGKIAFLRLSTKAHNVTLASVMLLKPKECEPKF